jgi:hypothetical protein
MTQQILRWMYPMSAQRRYNVWIRSWRTTLLFPWFKP